MMFNVTFNNISVKLWRSVLLVEETVVPGENFITQEKRGGGAKGMFFLQVKRKSDISFHLLL